MRHVRQTSTVNAKSVNVISLKEALDQGLTGSFLRIVANSLERTAKSLPASATVKYIKDSRGHEASDEIHELTNFNPRGNMDAAFELRRVAKAVDAANRTRKGL